LKSLQDYSPSQGADRHSMKKGAIDETMQKMENARSSN